MIPFVALQMIPVIFVKMLSRTLSGGFAPPAAWQTTAVFFMVLSAARKRYCFMCYKRYCLRAMISKSLVLEIQDIIIMVSNVPSSFVSFITSCLKLRRKTCMSQKLHFGAFFILRCTSFGLLFGDKCFFAYLCSVLS